MQTLRASDLFKNKNSITSFSFDENKNINLDFSNIKTIDLNAIKILLNLQKVALLNNKTLSISNVNPQVSKVLDVTGLNKTFANVATNPVTRKNK